MTHHRSEPGSASGRLTAMFTNPLVAGAIVLAALGVTATAWYGARQSVEDQAAQRFDFQAEELKSAINDRMIGYEQVLWGGVGMFNASDSVSRDEWRTYVETVNIQQHWPGIQGLGFAVPVAPEQLDAHMEEIRAEGFSDYTVRPEGQRSEYSSIIFLEPFDDRNRRAFGFDMWSNDVRREAMARARDTGVAATSGPITLVQETDDDIQRGFLTYLPVYAGGSTPTTVEDRRSALLGWVYAPFRAGDLMHGIVGDDLDGLTFEVFAGTELTEETLLFDSDNDLHGVDDAVGDDLIRTSILDLQGQRWTIASHSGPNFISSTEALQPTLVAIAGLAINLLVFYVLASMGSVQRRATVLAETMTSELRSTQYILELRSDDLQQTADELQRSNTTLETTNAELEKSNNDLEQFIYTAAHDLQAPLRTISSYAILFEDTTTGLSDESREYLDRITGSAGRMSRLLTDLLAYARIGWDRHPSPVDLADLAATVVDDIAGSSSSEVALGHLPTVVGHEPHLRLLLQNLIENAVKFAKPDQPSRITIEAEVQDSCVVVSVRDNGVGFEPEYKDRIFSVFQRLPNSEHVPGTGIGLAHCRRIARMHHGDAWAESVPDVGSTFFFSIGTAASPIAEITPELTGVGGSPS